MDLLDRLLEHDAWTTRQLLLKCRGLPDEQLDRDFDIGHRTLRRTFFHIIRNVEVWADLMAGCPVRPDQDRSVGRTVAALELRLDHATADLARVSRSVASRAAWDEQWVDTLDVPSKRKTYGSGVAHIITHSMHHRAQLLYMLRKLGMEELPEGDVFSWEEATARSPSP